MTDDETDLTEKMNINEQQAKSPGISDWVSVKKIRKERQKEIFDKHVEQFDKELTDNA